MRVALIMTSLLVMLFLPQQEHPQLLFPAVWETGSKNPYYDLLGSEKNSWFTILYLLAKRHLNLSGRIAELSGKIRPLIFDDSPIEKSWKKIERVSKVHNHVSGRFLFCYKFLVCGYLDGSNFIPFDISLYRERGSGLDREHGKLNQAKKKAKQAEAAYREHRTQYQERR